MGGTTVLPGRKLLRTIVLPGRTIVLPERLASRLVFREGLCCVLPGRTVFMEQPPDLLDGKTLDPKFGQSDPNRD